MKLDLPQYVTPMQGLMVMFHFTDDQVVPFKSGGETFKAAKEPNKIYTLNGTIHGYNLELDPYIEEMFK